MLKTIASASLLVALLVTPTLADTDIVVENFDSYADTAAMLAVWGETIGNGTAAANPADQNSGILTEDTATFPLLQGKALDHIGATASTPGMVNQWGGVINQQNGQNADFNIAPSETQSVFLSYDIYDSASGNERMTLGLRHINVVGTTITTTNIVEMGFYNSNSADPTNPGDWSAAPVNNAAGNAQPDTPGFYNGRGYGTRVTIFGPISEPLHHHPDWQYFRTTGETWGGQAGGDIGFPLEIDRATDTDEFVTVGDVGAGWHRYTATITPTSVTFTLDLFRDGLRNTSTEPITPGGDDRPGTAGVDAKLVFPIAANPVGFNALRVGGPSGLLSAGAGAQAFDNIILRLIDVAAGTPGDFDNDGDVDGRDFLAWQRGESPNGDPGVSVSDVDLAEWQAAYNGGNLGAFSAVPEPTTAVLLLAVAGLAAVRRR